MFTSLIHLSNDVAKFGHLDSFSSFPFKNFLFQIKKHIKKGEKPLEQLYNRISERAISRCNVLEETDTILNPQVINFNSTKSNIRKMSYYDSIAYKEFTLSVKKIKNSFCYLKNNSILRITDIYVNNNRIILQGKTLLRPAELEHYPVSSLHLNIVVGNEWSTIKIFNCNDVCAKAVCIPCKKSYCFLPLIHTV